MDSHLLSFSPFNLLNDQQSCNSNTIKSKTNDVESNVNSHQISPNSTDSNNNNCTATATNKEEKAKQQFFSDQHKNNNNRQILVETNDSLLLPPLLEPPLKLDRGRPFAVSDPVLQQPAFQLNQNMNFQQTQPFFYTPAFTVLDRNKNRKALSLMKGRPINVSTPMFPVRKPIQTVDFDKLISDPSVTINPKLLQFIPASAWQNENISFGILVATFFRKRNSMHCKFPNKLYNALKMSVFMPEFIPHIGIEWVTESVFRVHRMPFAKLLGVRAIEGGLFHQQGNFPSHGFYELPFAESDDLSRSCGFGPVDLSLHRFVAHNTGLFRRSSTEKDLEKCRWNGK